MFSSLMQGRVNVGMVARLLYLHQKLWKSRKKTFKRFDMEVKVNDIKNINCIQLQTTRIQPTRNFASPLT